VRFAPFSSVFSIILPVSSSLLKFQFEPWYGCKSRTVKSQINKKRATVHTVTLGKLTTEQFHLNTQLK